MEMPPAPLCLLIHDGELGDLCELLGRVGLRFSERRGAATGADEARTWDLVIATPKRLLEFDVGVAGAMPMRIAVLDKDSRTLRAMLNRGGIDLIVRRPVHPAALRLLVLHCLYRGPEKRRSLRVSVGAPVRYRVGLRRRNAVLTDLSVTGCRLLTPQPLDRGRGLSLMLPAELSRGKAFSVRGRVVRCDAAEQPGVSTVAVAFGKNSTKLQQRLRALVATHAKGPAVLEDGDACGPLTLASGAPAAAGAGAAQAEAAEANDRRTSARHLYSKQVIALGVEAGRVLIGRDISMGGMRVDPNPEVSLGDDLQIALHLRAREEPLLVCAHVSRDDGDSGLVLQFHNLSESSESYLRRMVNFLPIMAMREEGDAGEGIIVSEILERRAAGRAELA